MCLSRFRKAKVGAKEPPSDGREFLEIPLTIKPCAIDAGQHFSSTPRSALRQKTTVLRIFCADPESTPGAGSIFFGGRPFDGSAIAGSEPLLMHTATSAMVYSINCIPFTDNCQLFSFSPAGRIHFLPAGEPHFHAVGGKNAPAVVSFPSERS